MLRGPESRPCDRKFDAERSKVTGRAKFILRDRTRSRCENFDHVREPKQPRPGAEPYRGDRGFAGEGGLGSGPQRPADMQGLKQPCVI
jgi:hypothetical protein